VDVHSYSHVLGTTTGTYVSGGSYPWFDGAVTSTSTYISFADNATVNGALLAASYVYTGTYANIIGNITANGGQVDLAGHSNVTGNISGSTYVFLGGYSAVDGNATSGTLQVDLYGHSSVTGSVTANGTYVNFGIGSSAGGAVQAKTYVDLGTGGIAGSSVTSQTSYVNGDDLNVTGDITASTTVDVHSNGTFGGNITAGGDITIYNSNTVTGDVTSTGGHVFINDHDTLTGDIRASGYVSIDDYTVINGDVTSTGSYVYISSHSTINGNVTAATTMTLLSTSSIRQCARSTGSGTMHLYSSSVGGGCCGAVGSCGKSCLHDNVPADCQTLHHMKVTTPASSGNNCSTTTATLSACANAACSTAYTWGVSGNLTASGSGMSVSYPSGAAFTIPFGSTSTVPGVGFSTANTGTLTLGATASSPTASSATTCSLGAGSTCSYPIGTTGCSALHHLKVVTSSNTGLTCNPTTATIYACGDAACATPYTGGVTGTLSAAGPGMTVNFPAGAGFTIASGSSSQTVVFQQTTAGSITLGATSTTPTASSATTCLLGASSSCSYTNSTSALVLNAGGSTVLLRSGNTTSMQIQAVRASDSSPNTCVAGLTGAQTIRFGCSYVDPAPAASSATVNTLPLTIGATGLNASGGTGAMCDGSTQVVSLTFDSNGLATVSNLGYDDVGSVLLSASYTGSGSTAGLSLSGSVAVKAAPNSFGISNVTAGPIKAGATFGARITAYNSKGVVAKNFGRESVAEGVRLSWTQKSPVGLASDGATSYHTGILTGSGVGAALTGFASGYATVSDLVMDEVGYGDLTATLASGSYLSTGYTVTGTTGTAGAVGRFIPYKFGVQVSSQGCGAFTYSGQPFTVQVTGQTLSGSRTYNFDGATWASDTTLGASGAAGSLSAGQSLLASAFVLGQASTSAPVFSYTNPLTGPSAAVSILASSTISGVSFSGASTPSAATLTLRSGRLRITNKFGSERSQMSLPVQLQYYNSNGLWVLNSDDACTKVPVSAVVLDNYLDARGAGTTSWTTSVVPTSGGYAIETSGGTGTLTLRPPQPQPATSAGPWYTGTVDVSLNLGLSSADRSCMRTPRPTTSTGAGRPWLRSQYGSKFGCLGALSFDHDPSARATFGVYAPEATRTVHHIEVP
jgi:cytoskeletal protein CcmA (bactofilin family)